MDTPDLWNRLRFDPADRGGHVESHFLKATSPDTGRAIWLKLTFLSPKGRPDEAVAEAWAIAFERGRPKIGTKETIAASAARWRSEPFELEVAGTRLSPGASEGSLRTAGRRIAWNLTFVGDAPPFLPFPARGMYGAPIPKFKLVSPYPDASFSGFVDVDGTRWEIDGWPGMQGHNWGRQHSVRYAWAHCNAFEDAEPGTWLEGFTGQVKLGPFTTPPITMVALSVGGRLVKFQNLVGILRPEGRVSYFRWYFRAEHLGHRIEGEAEASRGDLAGLRYANPTGPATHCLNSKLARMEFGYESPSGRFLRLRSQAAALEIGTHDTDHGVEMIL